MTLFEQWKEDMNLLYFEYNLYIEPKFKIIKVKKFNNHHVNSFGIWGNEKNGIMRLWINLKIYSNSVDYNNKSIKDEDERIFTAFKFHKQEWIKNTRKLKLMKLKV